MKIMVFAELDSALGLAVLYGINLHRLEEMMDMRIMCWCICVQKTGRLAK